MNNIDAGGAGLGAGAQPAPAPVVVSAPGFAGTVTVTTDTESTGLHVSNNECLDYTLTIDGVGPVFGFACGAKRILACPSANYPGNQNQYHWKHPDPPSNVDGPDTKYNLTMLFVGVTAGGPMTYTLVVKRIDATGNANTLKNIQYASSTATDSVTDSLEVFAI